MHDRLCRHCGERKPEVEFAKQAGRYYNTCLVCLIKRRKERYYAKQKANVAYIYILIDPFDNQPRYVGQAVDIKARYTQHIGDGQCNGTRCWRWVGSLLKRGQKPIMEVIETTTRELVDGRERYWITEYANRGHILVNAVYLPDDRKKELDDMLGIKYLRKDRNAPDWHMEYRAHQEHLELERNIAETWLEILPLDKR